MTSAIIVNSFNDDLSKVNITLELNEFSSDHNYFINFENASLSTFIFKEKQKITDKITSFDLDLSNEDISNLSSIVIYAFVFIEDKLTSICSLEIKRSVKNDYCEFSCSPNYIEFGQKFTIKIKTNNDSEKAILHINNKKININIANNVGYANLLAEDLVVKKTKSMQKIKVFLSDVYQTWLEIGNINILPDNSFALAVNSDSIYSGLKTIETTSQDGISFPNKGTNIEIDETIKRVTLSGNTTYNYNAQDFAKIQSYSICRSSSDAALLALSSQDINYINYGENETEEINYIKKCNRIYVLESRINTKYSSPVKKARILSNDLEIDNCKGVIAVEVDQDIWTDTNITDVYFIDGVLKKYKFKILSKERDIPFIWYLSAQNFDIDQIFLPENSCFNFIGYGTNNSYAYPPFIETPLPYIYHNDIPISAVNPQISTNYNNLTNLDKEYVYVVAEGEVNGSVQLFLYSFNIKNNETYGWKQLTFDGDNKNPRISFDKNENLHIVWESNRCKQSQIFYGVLGPDSRSIVNETFVSSIDKYSELRADLEQNDPTEIDSISPIYKNKSITALNLKKADSNFSYYGGIWTSYNKLGGTSLINTDINFEVEGNPSNQKFSVFSQLEKDEKFNYFDGYFSQLSYEINFKLETLCTDLDPNKNFSINEDYEVEDTFASWKSGFTAVQNSISNFNVYEKDYDNQYTINKNTRVYENVIPIVGSYKITESLYDEKQNSLRHFMLGIVPEKAVFTASNLETLSQWTTRTGFSSVYYQKSITKEIYTGKFKLAIVVETTANLSDKAIAEQKYQIIRVFGDRININDKNSFKITVHYSKARKQTLNNRTRDYFPNETDLRYNGNIVVSVNGKTQCGENFYTNFNDGYYNFDLGFGVAVVGEYRPLNVKPYDGFTNENLKVKLKYSEVFVGKHSLIQDEEYTYLAKSDRNVEDIYVPNLYGATTTLNAWDEIYGPDIEDKENRYKLTLGLDRSKVRLSQIPITYLGRNSQPSIVLDRNDNVHISWQSNRDDVWNIYYTSNQDKQNPFRFDTKISDTVGQSLVPAISVDGSGKKLITWHDDSDSKVFNILAAMNNTENADNLCITSFLDDFGFNEYSDEYEYGSSFSSICEMKFFFSNNTGIKQKFHFVAQFYFDEYKLSIADTADSRLDITNWYYIKNGQEIQFPYNGLELDVNETANIFYKISDSINVLNNIYYVQISFDNNFTTVPYDTIRFFCPNNQYSLCNIPCVFTNEELVQKQVHFRVSFYRDSGFTDLVFSSDSLNDSSKWVIGDYIEFPTSGITVNSNETISVYYNPEILTDVIANINHSNQYLICNSRYYIIIESLVDSNYNSIDSFAFECNCSGVKLNLTKQDKYSNDWQCSGQGKNDYKITNTTNNSLNSYCVGSFDNAFYVTWESYTDDSIPDIFFGVLDSSDNTLYFRSQGYFDKKLNSNFSSPKCLVSDFLNPAFFYHNSKNINRHNFNMNQDVDGSSNEVVSYYLENQLKTNELGTSISDITNCLTISVDKKDVVKNYHENTEKPISLVDKYNVTLNITVPHATYAVRLKNEDGEWSEWLPVNFDFYKPASSSSSSNLTFDYPVSLSDHIVKIDWRLSSLSGNKTVKCQAMTHFGISPEFSRNIIALYKNLDYKIDFFLSSNEDIPASIYNGYPIVSKQQITINKDELVSINSDRDEISNIYIKVTFLDEEYFNKVVKDVNGLKFNVVLKGKVIYDLPLTKQSPTALTFDYETPPINSKKYNKLVYTGSFSIEADDSFDNIDGLSAIQLKIPSDYLEQPAEFECKNKNITPERIKQLKSEQVELRTVDLQEFKQKYIEDISCTFGSSCYKEEKPEEVFNSDAVFEKDKTAIPVLCEEVFWNFSKKSEPCFYINTEFNNNSWTYESSVIELDFSDPRIDYLSLTGSILQGVLLIIKPDDIIGTIEESCPTTSSSSSSNGKMGRSVFFDIPDKSFVVYRNSSYYCFGPSECNFPSSEKTFTTVSSVGVIEEGSFTNDTTDGTSSWSIPYALGKDDTLSSSSSSSFSDALLVDIETGISAKELKERGYMSANGILRFKLVFIPSGISYANIRLICGVSCDA